jgi:FdhD protein
MTMRKEPSKMTAQEFEVRMSRDVVVLRVGPSASQESHDVAAVEEPLQIRIGGEPFAVIMRTPGSDRELVAGFLLTERVISSARSLVSIRVLGGPAAGEPHNVVEVALRGEKTTRAVPARRVTTNASCGVCGRQTIDALVSDIRPVTASWLMKAAVVAALPARLRDAQPLFAATGGLHAAGLFTPDGKLDVAAEDVGRHNAVDKIVGRFMLEDRLPVMNRALCVSGRASFEIVQKAMVAGIPIIVAVSAPSSLAIELADTSGVTLVGFARGGGFNIYTHAQRIASVDL